MRQRIARVGVQQASKIAALLYFIIGVIVVPFVMLGSIGRSGGLGVGAALVIPFLYGAFGYIGTAIFTALYNALAGFLGGVEIDLVPAEADTAPTAP